MLVWIQNHLISDMHKWPLGFNIIYVDTKEEGTLYIVFFF